jgi:hypothetical protein
MYLLVIFQGNFVHQLRDRQVCRFGKFYITEVWMI